MGFDPATWAIIGSTVLGVGADIYGANQADSVAGQNLQASQASRQQLLDFIGRAYAPGQNPYAASIMNFTGQSMPPGYAFNGFSPSGSVYNPAYSQTNPTNGGPNDPQGTVSSNYPAGIYDNPAQTNTYNSQASRAGFMSSPDGLAYGDSGIPSTGHGDMAYGLEWLTGKAPPPNMSPDQYNLWQQQHRDSVGFAPSVWDATQQSSDARRTMASLNAKLEAGQALTPEEDALRAQASQAMQSSWSNIIPVANPGQGSTPQGVWDLINQMGGYSQGSQGGQTGGSTLPVGSYLTASSRAVNASEMPVSTQPISPPTTNPTGGWLGTQPVGSTLPMIQPPLVSPGGPNDTNPWQPGSGGSTLPPEQYPGQYNPPPTGGTGGTGSSSQGMFQYVNPGTFTYNPSLIGSSQGFNVGQDGLMQMNQDPSIKANLDQINSGATQFDNSQLFASMQPLFQNALNEQVGQLHGSAGSLGERFGSSMQQNEAKLRTDALAQQQYQIAQIGQTSFENAQNRRLQGLGLSTQNQQQMGALGLQAAQSNQNALNTAGQYNASARTANDQFAAGQGNQYNNFILQSLLGAGNLQQGQSGYNAGLLGILGGIGVPQQSPSALPGAIADAGSSAAMLPLILSMLGGKK